MHTIKLQKRLAAAGIASRRTIEEWIEQGRIQVNGTKAEIGTRVSARDSIHINGKRQRFDTKPQTTEWILYHKPEGEITSRRDPQQRPSVFQSIPRPRQGRWVAVGRLDINTSGLLIFTNNGECANYLMHPSSQITRTYMARVRGMLSTKELIQLKEGIDIDGKIGHFLNIDFAGGETKNFWYKITLSEGQNREVRRLFGALGHDVGRLMRIQYGDIALPPNLKRGQHRHFTSAKHPYLQHIEQQAALLSTTPTPAKRIPQKQHTKPQHPAKHKRHR